MVENTVARTVRWSNVDSDLGARVRAGLTSGNGTEPSAAAAATSSAATR